MLRLNCILSLRPFKAEAAHAFRRILTVIVVLVIALGLSRTSARALDKVSVAHSGVLSYSPLYIALDKGYLKDEGVEIELIQFNSGGSQLTSTATGQVDVGFGAVAASLFNAAAKGLDLKVVSSSGILAAPLTITPLVVRKVLFDSGAIKSGADLAKRRVAVSTPGGSAEYKLSLILASYGLSLKDVSVINLGYPDQMNALQAGGIDAGIIAEPFAFEATRRGVGVIIPKDSDVASGTAGVVIMYSGKFIRERPAVGVKVMRAFIRAAKELQGERWKEPETLEILSKYTKLSKETILGSTFPYFDPNLAIEPYLANLKDQMEVHIRNGRMEASAAVSMDKVVDLGFGKAAVASFSK